MIYQIWKLLHIIAVIVFLGNIIVSRYKKNNAEKSKDKIKLNDTFKNISSLDRVLTMPSVTGIIIFGLGTAMQGDYSLIETSWIFWSIILLIISAYAFMSKLIPIQRQIIKTLNADNFSWEEYSSLSKKWNLWDSVAIITPYLAVVLMVLKNAI